MARTQASARLRRLCSLWSIGGAITRVGPTTIASIGLMDVATACRARGVRAWATRDELLTIACEWDITRDRLQDQSDACLAAVIRVLRVRLP